MGRETFHVRCNARSGQRDEAPSLCWLRSYHTWTSSEVLSLCLTDVKHQHEHHHVAEEGEAGCPHVRHPSRLEDEVRGERHLLGDLALRQGELDDPGRRVQGICGILPNLENEFRKSSQP